MAIDDADKARDLNVAVPPTSKDEYLAASAALQPGFNATSDATDLSVGWTAGETGIGEVAFPDDPNTARPGQVYAPHQLPDPMAAVRAGLPPVRVPEHLILDSDDAVDLQGMEPSEVSHMDYREELRAKLLEERQAVQDEIAKFKERLSGDDQSGSKSSKKASASSASSSSSSATPASS